jgi:hypothetical protein
MANQNALTAAIDKTKPHQVELSPAIVALIVWLMDGDREKRSFDFWLDQTIVSGYEYQKRARKQAEDRERHKKADADKIAFDRAVAGNPTILANPEALIALAQTYNQMDGILAKTMQELVKAKAQAQTAGK